MFPIAQHPVSVDGSQKAYDIPMAFTLEAMVSCTFPVLW